MGRIFVLDLEGSTYRCKSCETQLALVDDLVSREFHCNRGKTYLFSKVANVTVGPDGTKLTVGGMHTAGDLFCCSCGQKVGCKYEHIRKIKQGKFALERDKILDEVDTEICIDNDSEDAA